MPRGIYERKKVSKQQPPASLEAQCKLCGKNPSRPGGSVCDSCMGLTREVLAEMDAQAVSEISTGPQEDAIETSGESTDETRTCETCGNTFSVYFHGRSKMVRKCLNCLRETVKDSNAERSKLWSAIKNGGGHGYVVIDLRHFPKELGMLEKLASRDFRTLNAQVTFMIMKQLQQMTEET